MISIYRLILLGLLTVGILSLGSAPASGAAPLAVMPKGQQGCAAGTVVAGLNKVVNGDFNIPAGPGPGIAPAAKFISELPNVGPDTYPYDEIEYNGVAGGFSIISTEVFTVPDRTLIYGYRFPGDPRRDVPPLDHYFYAKPSNITYTDAATPGYALLWSQPVTLTVGTTYNFYAYFNNMRIPSLGDNNFINPQIQLLVNGTPAGSRIEIRAAPDEWLPVQFSFLLSGPPVGTQTQVKLEIRDYAGVRNLYASDDFAMTGVNLKQCVSGLGIAFTNLPPIANRDGTYDVSFVTTVRNYGVDPLPLSKLQLTVDMSAIANASQSFQIVSISSDTASLTVNSGFNGTSNIHLLSESAANTINSGVMARVRFTARIKPGTGPGALGPFDIQVGASASAGTDTQTGGDIEVGDISTPGMDPDPDDDHDPGDDDPPTPIYITPFKISLPVVRR